MPLFYGPNMITSPIRKIVLKNKPSPFYININIPEEPFIDNGVVIESPFGKTTFTLNMVYTYSLLFDNDFDWVTIYATAKTVLTSSSGVVTIYEKNWDINQDTLNYNISEADSNYPYEYSVELSGYYTPSRVDWLDSEVTFRITYRNQSIRGFYVLSGPYMLSTSGNDEGEVYTHMSYIVPPKRDF